MRVVFLGASALGWHCCRAVIESGAELAGIFSIPSQFRISWSPSEVRNVQFRDFTELAAESRAPLIWVRGRMSDPIYLDTIRRLAPDLIVVIGWYYLVPRAFRDAARLGAVGIHASMLPRYRGGAPLVWAVLRGETDTGVTMFHLDDGVDTGDVIGQQPIPIAFEDDISKILEKATAASITLVRQYIPRLADGSAPRIAQDHSRATVVPQRTPSDGRLVWGNLDARAAYNWIRAQSRPYPGAFTTLAGSEIKIWRARPPVTPARTGAVPGTILPSDHQGIAVACADNSVLLLEEIEAATDAEPLHLHGLRPGVRFDA
jgi:methionyl-tRNA formyltransferase